MFYGHRPFKRPGRQSSSFYCCVLSLSHLNSHSILPKLKIVSEEKGICTLLHNQAFRWWGDLLQQFPCRISHDKRRTWTSCLIQRARGEIVRDCVLYDPPGKCMSDYWVRPGMGVDKSGVDFRFKSTFSISSKGKSNQARNQSTNHRSAKIWSENSSEVLP